MPEQRTQKTRAQLSRLFDFTPACIRHRYIKHYPYTSFNHSGYGLLGILRLYRGYACRMTLKGPKTSARCAYDNISIERRIRSPSIWTKTLLSTWRRGSSDERRTVGCLRLTTWWM